MRAVPSRVLNIEWHADLDRMRLSIGCWFAGRWELLYLALEANFALSEFQLQCQISRSSILPDAVSTKDRTLRATVFKTPCVWFCTAGSAKKVVSPLPSSAMAIELGDIARVATMHEKRACVVPQRG